MINTRGTQFTLRQQTRRLTNSYRERKVPANCSTYDKVGDKKMTFSESDNTDTSVLHRCDNYYDKPEEALLHIT